MQQYDERTCARDHGLFIFITHKSTRSEKPIAETCWNSISGLSACAVAHSRYVSWVLQHGFRCIYRFFYIPKQIAISAKRGTTYEGDIAVDAIVFEPGMCISATDKDEINDSDGTSLSLV